MKIIRLNLPVLAMTALLLLVPVVDAAADELTDQARSMIEAGRHAEAYNLLIIEIAARAGTPEYDLLLGLAAMEAGYPTQAVFAFERVLAVEPGNSRARLELARAYYDMGENEASRDEFTQARTQQVPAEVIATIEEYLTAIDDRLQAATMQRRLNFYLQLGAGYDSNVNGATDSSTVALPAFGNLVFTLDETSRELDSGFYALDGGVSYSSRIAPRVPLSVLGAVNLSYRPAWNEHRFDTAAADAQLGLRYTVDNNAFIASLQGQRYLIDDDTNRDQGGLTLQWLHMAGDRTQFSVFAQGLAQRFPDQSIRDVNQYSGGIGYVHLLRGAGSPILYGSVYYGTDDERVDTRPDIGRKYYGIRGGVEYTLRENLKYIGSISYQHSLYGGDDPLFRERRKDDFVFARGGLEYFWDENWVITPEIRYMLNDSSLVINEFDRWQVFATARFNF